LTGRDSAPNAPRQPRRIPSYSTVTCYGSYVASAAYLKKRCSGQDIEADMKAEAVADYRASLDNRQPLSERKLAAMFGRTSRRWARHRMAEARQALTAKIADTA
jgi:hypothetical protein